MQMEEYLLKYEVFNCRDANLKETVDIKSNEWTFFSKSLQIPCDYWKTKAEFCQGVDCLNTFSFFHQDKFKTKPNQNLSFNASLMASLLKITVHRQTSLAAV